LSRALLRLLEKRCRETAEESTAFLHRHFLFWVEVIQKQSGTDCAASVENAVLGDWGMPPQQAKSPGVRTGTLLATIHLTQKQRTVGL